MNDDALIEAWKRYRADLLARSESTLPGYVDFNSHALPAETTTDMQLFVFRQLVGSHVHALINLLNSWRNTQLRLASWARVLSTRSEGERALLLLEFVHPLAERAVDMPYRAKQAMIFLGYRLLEHGCAGVVPVADEKIDFKILKKLTTTRPAFADFMGRLEALDAPELRASTGNHRALRHHRFAPGIEMGVLPTVVTYKDGAQVTHSFGLLEPLSLERLCAELEPERLRALICFENLWMLVLLLDQDLGSGRS